MKHHTIARAIACAGSLLIPSLASASAVGPQLADLFFFDAPDDTEWHLLATGFPAAWRLQAERGRAPGEGVVIAFPDTGTTLHPEILRADGSSPFVPGYDFIDDDSDPRDDLRSVAPYDFPGHATQALSVITSPRGPAHSSEIGAPFISGAAPAADILASRVGRSVFVTDPGILAASVRHSVDNGAHILLITRGSASPDDRVEHELRRAIARGVIVIAAAGNGVPFVVYPARYPGVVAVAGTTADDEPWAVSSFGPEVTIAAPGENVWAAYPYRGGLGGDIRYLVKPAGGTTIASSLVAAAAANWLTFHGRDELIARYGEEGLVWAFHALLRQTARRPVGWPKSGFGAGILDVEALIRAPLPGSDAPAPLGVCWSSQELSEELKRAALWRPSPS